MYLKNVVLFLKIARVIRDIHEGFVCAVINNGETSDRFRKIKSGVKQGCVMSGLFLPVVDWVMRTTRAGMQRGIRWNCTTVFDDLDFADYIASLSFKLNYLREKPERLSNEAATARN